MSYTKVHPHGNSSKTEHPDIRTFQYLLNAERQLLQSNKPHKVYKDLVATADPFTTSSQSEEPRNLRQIQNGKYLIQKKQKPMKRLTLIDFLFWYFCYLRKWFSQIKVSQNSQGSSRSRNQILPTKLYF